MDLKSPWIYWRSKRKNVPFGNFVDIAPHSGSQIPQKNKFESVNKRQEVQIRHKQIQEKSKSLNISAKDWPILTKSGRVMRLSSPSAINPKNRNISKMVGMILTEFGVLVHNGLLYFKDYKSTEIGNKTAIYK